jgi:hypothetical protein
MAAFWVEHSEREGSTDVDRAVANDRDASVVARVRWQLPSCAVAHAVVRFADSRSPWALDKSMYAWASSFRLDCRRVWDTFNVA